MSILHAAATHCCTAPHRLSRRIIHPQRLKDHSNTYYLTLYPVTGLNGIDYQDFQHIINNIVYLLSAYPVTFSPTHSHLAVSALHFKLCPHPQLLAGSLCFF